MRCGVEEKNYAKDDKERRGKERRAKERKGKEKEDRGKRKRKTSHNLKTKRERVLVEATIPFQRYDTLDFSSLPNYNNQSTHRTNNAVTED